MPRALGVADPMALAGRRRARAGGGRGATWAALAALLTVGVFVFPSGAAPALAAGDPGTATAVVTPVAPTPVDTARQAATTADLDATDRLAAAAAAEQDAVAAAAASASAARTTASSGRTAVSAFATTATGKGGGGDTSATPLSPSSTWTAGGNRGSFSWSYPLRVPSPEVGPKPQLALSYDSGVEDGRLASTNNQPSWVGEGFDIPVSYIERSYASCRDDGQSKKYDLCWKDYNASLVLNGHATSLVLDDTTQKWRLADDDGSVVERLAGAANGDNNGEHWRLTTSDGTQYWFGLNALPNAPSTTRTKSVFTVPVSGDDAAEPCHQTGFADSFCQQAWRWNLDYVVDLHGNAETFWYVPEINYYAKNGASTATSSYQRGGWLDHIDYGLRSTDLFGQAAHRVSFSVAERCLSSATNCADLTSAKQGYWPDVPFDSICVSGGTCKAQGSPSFFTRKRLTGITTSSWNATLATPAWSTVDTWAFTQVFLDPGDTGDTRDQTMWLSKVQHTNTVDGAVALSPVRFAALLLPNRVDGPSDSQLPLNKPRLIRVLDESGASTNISYSDPDCSPTSHPAVDANTRRCFPSFWYPPGYETPVLDWFQKYVVTSVTVAEPFGASPLMTTSYSYVGGAAWHYATDPITPKSRRTWSSWRGYEQVVTTTGDPAEGPQSRSASVFLRGMDGDLKADGTTTSRTVTGIKAPAIRDSAELAGFSRETVTYNGTAEVSGSIMTPWSQQTASQAVNGYTAKAFFVRTGATRTRTVVTSGSTPTERNRTITTTFDPVYGTVTSVDDTGAEAASGDEACTTTWYARNANINLAVISRVQTLGTSCASASTAALPTTSASTGAVISDVASGFDVPTTTWTATQTPTKGDVTWTGRPTGYASGVASWQTLTTSEYDALGRVVKATDAGGNMTSTSYTAAATSTPRQMKVVNPKLQSQVTSYDPRWGAVTKVIDAAGMVTETTYDGLGRVRGVWLPSQPRAGSLPSVQYAYSITPTAAPWVSKQTIGQTGTSTVTSWTIYDGLMRERETQAPSPRGGRVITATQYDSRGLRVNESRDIYDTTGDPGPDLVSTTAQPPAETVTSYDGAGRAVTTTFKALGQTKWATTTSYTGDSVATTGPVGGYATRDLVDGLGRIVEHRQYSGTSPTGTTFSKVGTAYDARRRPASVTGPDGAVWSYSYDLYGRTVSSVDPDKGTSQMRYTVRDALDWSQDSRGKTLLFDYDELGRKTAEYEGSRSTATQTAAWTYDTVQAGRMTQATRYVGGTTGSAWTKKVTKYDAMGHAMTTVVGLPATDPLVAAGVPSTLTFQQAWNGNGTQAYEVMPAVGGLPADYLTHEYDAIGDEVRMPGYVEHADYTPLQQLERLDLYEGVGEHVYVGDRFETGTGRLTQRTVGDSLHSWLPMSTSYAYDAAGNITGIFDASTLGGASSADNQCFTFDGYRRITEAWTPKTPDCASTGRTTANLGGPAPSWTSYTYDSAGQRKTETAYTATAKAVTTYTYGASLTAQPHALKSAVTVTTPTSGTATTSSRSYGYDVSGNTTTRPGTTAGVTQTLAWDASGRLSSATEPAVGTTTPAKGTSYLYDADGELLVRRPSTADGETVLYLGATEVHLTVKGTTKTVSTTRRISFGGRVIQVRSAVLGSTAQPKHSWTVGDPVQTSTLSIDAATLTVTRRYFTVFGTARGSKPAWIDDHGFLGKPVDAGTGLVHVGAREYDAVLGRFLSVDPLLDKGDPQSLNGYAYGNANPLAFPDPTGLDAGDSPSACAYIRCAPGSNRAERPASDAGADTEDKKDHSRETRENIARHNAARDYNYWLMTTTRTRSYLFIEYPVPGGSKTDGSTNDGKADIVFYDGKGQAYKGNCPVPIQCQLEVWEVKKVSAVKRGVANEDLRKYIAAFRDAGITARRGDKIAEGAEMVWPDPVDPTKVLVTKSRYADDGDIAWWTRKPRDGDREKAEANAKLVNGLVVWRVIDTDGDWHDVQGPPEMDGLSVVPGVGGVWVPGPRGAPAGGIRVPVGGFRLFPVMP